MKKLLLFSFAVLVTMNLLSAQEVPQIQKSLLTKVTATWCPNCGGWGWGFFKGLIEDNESKAVFIGAHHSGDLQSAPGSAFTENFESPYQPYFYHGNDDLNVNGGNTSSKRQEVKTLVNSTYEEAPLANVGLEVNTVGDNFTIKTKTEFFQEANGEYYLGIYILEDGVINFQASQGSNAVHSYVLRAAADGQNFGSLIDSGTIPAGNTYNYSTSIAINQSWALNNVSVIGIIWEKIDDTYHFVNVNNTNQLVTSVQTIASSDLSVQLFPTVSRSQASLNLELNTNQKDLNIQVFDLNGKAVQSVFSGDLYQGSESFTIDTRNLATGAYFVRILATNGAVLTRKLIIQ